MKKFTLSAIICFTLFNTSNFAQQTSTTVTPATPPAKTFDASKLTEKEISMELDAGKSDIYIDNNSRTIEIKSWNQPKVKISTKVYVDGASTLTNQQWFERLNLSIKPAAGLIQITSRNVSSSATVYTSAGTGSSSANSLGVAIFNAEGKNIGTLQNAKRIITIFIPESNKLEIDNLYGSMQLAGNFQNVVVKSTSGSIETGDINRLEIRSKYTPFVVGNVKEADIEMTNGRLKGGHIGQLSIDSKYSTIELVSVNDIMLRSANDEYEIEDAGDIRGRKTYGNLRVYTLKTSIDVEGANADIKVRNLGATVESIKINNKYADIRLPVSSLKNFAVRFSGSYNTVYAPFEKKPLTDATNKTTEGKGTGTNAAAKGGTSTTVGSQTYVSYTDASDAKGFTAEVGNTKGKHTKFIINCASCTVDFK